MTGDVELDACDNDFDDSDSVGDSSGASSQSSSEEASGSHAGGTSIAYPHWVSLESGYIYANGTDTHPYGRITPAPLVKQDGKLVPQGSFRGQMTCKCYKHRSCSLIFSNRDVRAGVATVESLMDWCARGQGMPNKEDGIEHRRLWYVR